MAEPVRPTAPEDEKPCGFPETPCSCTNGIGCVNVPFEEW